MRNFAGIFLCLFCCNAFAQIQFENGYFIDNSGVKKEVFIRNADWRSNPEQFEYRLAEESEVQTAKIEAVKEFVIYDHSKYIRATVGIDRSSNRLGDLRENGAPIMQKEQLYLQVLIEGETNLYGYTDGALQRFFYSRPDSEINQLIWKKYLTRDGKITENNQFKQQLWNKVKCGDITPSQLERLKYEKESLINYFKKYNECRDADVVEFNPSGKKDFFNLNIRPRFNSSSLTITNPTSSTQSVEFDRESGFGVGLEAEFILPFNKNKWSLFVEPTYQSYKSERNYKADNISGGEVDALVEYTSIEIPLGARHYIFLNEKSAVFANVAYVIDIDSGSEVEFKRSFNGSTVNKQELSTEANLALGVGYNYKKRYSLELRYQTAREVLGDYMNADSDYNTFSVVFGYSIL
ncbi:autotransporter outer membrane beta-barrel domain-containing protein [Christiangramia aquimixticola]|uniref:autotransporter outer membrane beta-barrel domain-containing protein n=1 Tax=Christiangramia aquimixticola TaxID=1697558 RepID=UPI003AA7DBF7